MRQTLGSSASIDDRMCKFARCFELLEAAFYCRHLVFESGRVVCLTACSSGRLVCEALPGAFQQALLRERAGLQARDGGIDSDIFGVAATVEGE